MIDKNTLQVRAVLITVLTLLTLFSCTRIPEQKTAFVPVLNNIYEIDSSGSYRIIKSINGFFSSNCFSFNNSLLVYAQIRTKNATTIEGIYSINTLSGRIKPLIEDTLSLFIATESKIITIAKYIYDSTGFRINKYNLNEKYLTKKKSQFLCSMDITVNDWELLNDSLLALSGQHIDTLVNRVYLLNLNTGKFSKIAEKAASRSFLKLLSFENKLLIYQSTATIPDAKHMLWYKIFDHNGNCFLNTNDTILLSDQNMAFFGKGLYANNQIFLPGISSDSSTSIVVITTNPSLKIKNTIPSTTSIYKVAQGQLDERNIPIIGYNYYKNPTAFYLLFLDSQKEAIRSCRLIE